MTRDSEYINTLAKVSGILPKDCFEEENTIVFLVNSSQMGAAIGKKGKNVESLRNIFKKNVEVFEYCKDVESFLRKNLKIEIQKIEEENNSITLHLRPEDKKKLLGNRAKIRRIKKILEKNYKVKGLRLR